MHDFISSVVFEPCNEEDAGLGPLEEEFKVQVPPVDGDDATGGKREMAGGSDIGSLAIGDHGEVRQIAVVIQEQVELDGAFGLTEVSPGKQAETKVDGRGVEAEYSAQPRPES